VALRDAPIDDAFVLLAEHHSSLMEEHVVSPQEPVMGEHHLLRTPYN
jgi:hypothetical protein